MNNYLEKMILPDYVSKIIKNSPSVMVPESRAELIEKAFCGQKDTFNVEYEVEGKGKILEATVTRCNNGAVINYPSDYMRRRDPDCLLVADELDTDKPKYDDVYKDDFEPLRQASFDWLEKQELIIIPFYSGGSAEYGYESILIAPGNAGFFAAGLGDLQGMIPAKELPDNFTPKAIIFLVPPFRHTHFDGKQIVVHNRLENMHELFSFNLYPGPSAKKGIYGVLLNIGENEGWVTVHASTVKVVTPYDNEIVIMHEGASGGGKSEMLEEIHKTMDGKIVVGENLVTKEKVLIELNDTCDLLPVTDDMAICHPKMQNDSKKLVVKDAESGWFLRLDHIKEYGTSPQHEKIFIHPKEPLIFLNLKGAPDSTCLPWEHTIDSDGKPCPNPRTILPRKLVDKVISEPVEIDVRSFGVRAPMCTKDNPTYGIMGMLSVLPPALAWLWRLVAPRGHNNPSITASTGMTSEGVGSYWPFATGKMVEQANLLLEQILASSNTRYLLIPNQHVGAYKVGFMPQWLTREYIARRGGAKFRQEHLVNTRCSLFGYTLDSLKIDGKLISKSFLQPELQAEVGVDAYDKGAALLIEFFAKELEKFDVEELHPLGRKIIEVFKNNGTVEDYINVIPMHY